MHPSIAMQPCNLPLQDTLTTSPCNPMHSCHTPFQDTPCISILSHCNLNSLIFIHPQKQGHRKVWNSGGPRNSSDSRSKILGGHSSNILVLNWQNLGGTCPLAPPVPTALFRKKYWSQYQYHTPMLQSFLISISVFFKSSSWNNLQRN